MPVESSNNRTLAGLPMLALNSDIGLTVHSVYYVTIVTILTYYLYI